MNSLVQRARNILLQPKSEWPVIAAEPATVKSIYVPYVLVLAAIGPICLLIGGGGFGFFRFGTSWVLRTAIWQYAMSLISIAVLAFIINALASTFASEKSTTQAFKTAAYAYTASWIAGIGSLLGFLGTLVALAGAAYSLYLLYLALPHTMKTPPEKATGYTVVIVIVAILLSLVLGAIGSAVLIGSRGSLGMFGGAVAPSRDAQVLDPDSPLGRLEKMGRDMEKAEQDGKMKDPGQALGAVMGAMAGAGGAIEALPADTLKGFVPDALGGLARQSIAAEKNGVLGMQISSAKARYGAGDNELRLEITDSGGAAGLAAFAGWANIEQSREEGTRTERSGREGGRFVHEQWDSASSSGEYSVIIGDRFVVKVEGNAGSLGDLRSAAGSVNLAGLEALKDQGKKR